MNTVYDCADPDARKAGLDSAVNVLRSGRLTVFPTDTVYAIGADAFNADAVRSLLSAKGRASTKPAGVLVGSWSTVDGLVLSVPSIGRQLIEAFWPGGLSLVMTAAPSLAWDLGETRGTVMVRMPLHPVAIELLREFGPIAQSSANRTGSTAATDVEQARDQLGDAIGTYLDGGPSGESVASTIVDLTGNDPLVLREGAVSLAEIGEVLGRGVPVAQ